MKELKEDLKSIKTDYRAQAYKTLQQLLPRVVG